MKSFVVALAYAFIAFSAISYAHDEWQITIQYLGIAIDAETCKTKCGQSQHRFHVSTTVVCFLDQPNCVAWGHTRSNERCAGWILSMDDISINPYYYYRSDNEFDYAGVIASPNITDSSSSSNTPENCSFLSVDLGTQHTQSQQCAAACQNCKS